VDAEMTHLADGPDLPAEVARSASSRS